MIHNQTITNYVIGRELVTNEEYSTILLKGFLLNDRI